MSAYKTNDINETTSLLLLSETFGDRNLQQPLSNSYKKRWIRSLSPHWIPFAYEEHEKDDGIEVAPAKRSIRRRIFLLLNEPESSVFSAVFFFISILAIALMNVIMILQTMEQWQFIPNDCHFCGGSVAYGAEVDVGMVSQEHNYGTPCVCPPSPLPWTVWLLDRLVRFFTVEWVLRVITFDPPPSSHSEERRTVCQKVVLEWIPFLTSSSTVLDALAIFPYYIEAFTSSNGLLSLRLLRLFRVFQILRLGQYHDTFQSLSAVLVRSIPFLKLFLGVLFLGAALFGSILYWLEMGTWQYFPPTQSYQFVRLNPSGAPEISPFSSIPVAFWWFAVTVTTVGYGDIAPTTACGKWIAAIAMLLGVLVIAFPVSIFSDLWSKELRRTGALSDLQNGDAVPLDGNAVLAESLNGSRLTSCDDGIMDTNESTNKRRNYADAEHIVMEKDDFADILSHLEAINESQQHIRSILRKYHLSHSSKLPTA